MSLTPHLLPHDSGYRARPGGWVIALKTGSQVAVTMAGAICSTRVTITAAIAVVVVIIIPLPQSYLLIPNPSPSING